MLVRMYEHKALMDAGRERTLSPGVVYDVSPVLGSQWVQAGVAVEEAAASDAPTTTPRERSTPRRKAETRG